jgi:hypothetical protein
VDGSATHIDLSAPEVEECESIVAGDPWRRIARFIELLKQAQGAPPMPD